MAGELTCVQLPASNAALSVLGRLLSRSFSRRLLLIASDYL